MNPYQIALQETLALLKADPTRRDTDPTLPLFRLAAEDQLKLEMQRFTKGNKMALFSAIRVCANHDLPLPEWASRAFIAAYDQVLNCNIGSWDEAFGKPYPGKQLKRLAQRRNLQSQIWLDIVRRPNPKDSPIDVGLFEAVGHKYGIGATLCGELYYAAKRMTSIK